MVIIIKIIIIIIIIFILLLLGLWPQEILKDIENTIICTLLYVHYCMYTIVCTVGLRPLHYKMYVRKVQNSITIITRV